MDHFTCWGETRSHTPPFPKTDPKPPLLQECSRPACPTVELPHRVGYKPCRSRIRTTHEPLGFGSSACPADCPAHTDCQRSRVFRCRRLRRRAQAVLDHQAGVASDVARNLTGTAADATHASGNLHGVHAGAAGGAGRLAVVSALSAEPVDEHRPEVAARIAHRADQSRRTPRTGRPLVSNPRRNRRRTEPGRRYRIDGRGRSTCRGQGCHPLSQAG